jgi:protein SCO1
MKYYILPILLLLTILSIFFAGNFSSNSGIVNVNKKIKTNIFNNYNSEFIFVFFGYVGCTDICTPRLEELSKIYKKLKYTKGISIDTSFINLIKLKDKELPNLFASSFHKDFDGFYLDEKILRNMKNEFQIYSSPSLTSKGDWDHTSFLFLLKKQTDGYYLKSIYTHVPFNEEKIIKDIMENLND